MRNCAIEGCERSYFAQGFCSTHYKRWRKHGDPLVGARNYQRGPCAVEGCERQQHSRNLCGAHYQQWKQSADADLRALLAESPSRPLANLHAPCSVDGCDRPTYSRALCTLHYNRMRRRGDTGGPDLERAPKTAWTEPCRVDGCALTVVARGYCHPHYSRVRKTGDPQPDKPFKRQDGVGYIGPDGYRILCKMRHPNAGINGRIAEHRWLMAEALGRPLLPDETVHHKNGIRHDNRMENLELWSRNHGPGQRVEDIVAYSLKMLGRYAPESLA